MNSQTSINDTQIPLTQINGQTIRPFQRQLSNVSAITKKRMFQVRRTFLLIVTFDFIFMILLWIIYKQIKNETVVDAFIADVIRYDIHSSLMDIVGLSGLRFVMLMVAYAIIKWSHWITVAITTLGSTGFIIAKTCLLTISKSDRSFTDYTVLIASFILAWVEIWFFDYRVIPHERRLREALISGDRRPLLGSNTSRSTSPIPPEGNYHSVDLSNEARQSFYSPVPSLENSDNEDSFRDARKSNRSESNLSQPMLGTPTSVFEECENDYESQADEIIENIWKIFQDDKSWVQEAKSADGNDLVQTKTYIKWGKVFRLTGLIPASRDDLVELLFDRQEDMSKWNPTVNDCRILEVIHHDLYIAYQLTNEQAQGIIAKRDFVNITARRFIDDVAILAAQACNYPKMPAKDNCVRGENGPTAYILEKIDESNSRFTWLLNVDLKGWLPQYLINSSLASAQLTLIDSLRKYLSRSSDMTSSYSSASYDLST